MSVVLGFDTATDVLTVAVSAGGEVLRESSEDPESGGRPRHSALLLREIERSVDAAGGWEHIDRIAVGLGPGSYTGLRIGIATARALAQARSLPVAGVGSLAALAAAIAAHPDAEGRPALPLLDARRGQAFAALHAPDGEELWQPRVLAPEELAEKVRGLDPAPLAGGDGSLRFASELEAAGAAVASPDDPVHRIAARWICALGEQTETSPPELIGPIYLRPPDADKWRERDGKDS